MNKFFILGLMLVAALSVRAQTTLSEEDDYVQPADWQDFLNGLSFFVNKDQSTNLDMDAMYLNPEWQEGTLVDLNGKRLEEQLIKYRIYDDEMLLFHEGGIRRIYPMQVESVIIEESVFCHRKFYKESGFLGLGYMELVQDGAAQLLLRREAALVEGNSNSIRIPGINRKTSSDDRFVIKNLWYIQKKDEEAAIRFKKGKRSFFEMLPENSDKLEDYARKNGLKFGNEEDLIKLISYYNKLITVQL